ncbi:unnamed protein product [Penicillium palitans]
MKSLTTLFMLTATTVAATLTSSSPKHFRLKSSGATNQEHNNLYIFAHHTGAGLNDTVLTKDMNNASSVYLNNTKALFDFDSKSPQGVVATGDIKKAYKYPPLERSDHAGQGSNGFSLKGNNFQWSEASGFGG